MDQPLTRIAAGTGQDVAPASSTTFYIKKTTEPAATIRQSEREAAGGQAAAGPGAGVETGSSEDPPAARGNHSRCDEQNIAQGDSGQRGRQDSSRSTILRRFFLFDAGSLFAAHGKRR